jgi:hypothetical protein
MTELTGSVATAGRGWLPEVLALRGGEAAPEAPIVIEHREALIYMPYEAAELEHGIMCQYLFAAFSLKQREDEGLTAAAREAVLRWRERLRLDVRLTACPRGVRRRGPRLGGDDPRLRNRPCHRPGRERSPTTFRGTA